MSRQAWTDQEREILKQIIENGGDMDDVKRILVGRSDGGIRAQMDRFGLEFKFEPKIDMDAFKAFMQGAKQETV